MSFMNESLCPVRLKTFTRQMYDEQQENSTQYTNHETQVQKYKRLRVSASDFNTFVYMPRPPFQASHSTLVEAVCHFCSTLKIVGHIVHCWQNCWLQASLVELFATFALH